MRKLIIGVLAIVFLGLAGCATMEMPKVTTQLPAKQPILTYIPGQRNLVEMFIPRLPPRLQAKVRGMSEKEFLSLRWEDLDNLE